MRSCGFFKDVASGDSPVANSQFRDERGRHEGGGEPEELRDGHGLDAVPSERVIRHLPIPKGTDSRNTKFKTYLCICILQIRTSVITGCETRSQI